MYIWLCKPTLCISLLMYKIIHKLHIYDHIAEHTCYWNRYNATPQCHTNLKRYCAFCSHVSNMSKSAFAHCSGYFERLGVQICFYSAESANFSMGNTQKKLPFNWSTTVIWASLLCSVTDITYSSGNKRKKQNIFHLLFVLTSNAHPCSVKELEENLKNTSPNSQCSTSCWQLQEGKESQSLSPSQVG